MFERRTKTNNLQSTSHQQRLNDLKDNPTGNPVRSCKVLFVEEKLPTHQPLSQ